MKGLLTGDLSVYIIQQIQTSIEKFQQDYKHVQEDIEKHLEKKQSLDQFFDTNFSVGSVIEQSLTHAPNYEVYQNFEQYLLLMEQGDWKKHIQIKDNHNYSSVNVTQFVNSDLLGGGQPAKQSSSLMFSDPENMQRFMETKIKEMQSTQNQKIETLKR